MTLVLAIVVFAADLGGGPELRRHPGRRAPPTRTRDCWSSLFALAYWPLTDRPTPSTPRRRPGAADEGGLTGMGTPTWLYYLFGVADARRRRLLLRTAGAVAVATRRRRVGMSTSPTRSWGCPWPACSSRRGPSARTPSGSCLRRPAGVVRRRSIQSVQRFGLHVPHALVHAVMSFAMILMYWFPMGVVGLRAWRCRCRARPAGSHLDAGLGLLLALVLLRLRRSSRWPRRTRAPRTTGATLRPTP